MKAVNKILRANISQLTTVLTKRKWRKKCNNSKDQIKRSSKYKGYVRLF